MDTADSVSSQTKEDPLQAILPKVKFVCKGRSEGYYADTDFDCEVFHYCKTSGFRFTFVCPPKSKFNQKQMTCDYEAKDSICTDAIRHQKQIFKQKGFTLPSMTGEKMSESTESITKSSYPGGVRAEIKKEPSETSLASFPLKHNDHTSLITLAMSTTTPSPNYYQFTGNSDKYVSPQIFEVTPKATTPIPTTFPSPVYKGEESPDSQSSATQSPISTLPSPPFNYSGFKFNPNDEDESFKPISLKGETFSSTSKASNEYRKEKNEKVSNDQQESSSPVASPNSLSSPAPAFSIIWNHEQNSFSSFKPSQPMQIKYSKSQNHLKPTQEQTINKLKITDLSADHPTYLTSPPTIQFHQFIPENDPIRKSPEKQGQQFASLNQFSFKHNEQPLGYDFQDGMMISNYDLQPLVSTTIPPLLMVTRTPTFHKMFNQPSQESFKGPLLPTFQKIKLKPAAVLKPPPNFAAQNTFSNEQLTSILNSGSFTSLEELEDMDKLPQTDHMFGLPKMSAPKAQNHFDHLKLPHNFHTQVPHMMPFNNHGTMNHGMNIPAAGNSGSFITELNNLFSKHFTRNRPGNLLPSPNRPQPSINLPKFSPNALTSWFNKPKDLNNINLMTSSSQQRPSFVEPPSSPSPQSPSPNQPKWGIFTSITKFFHSSAPQATLNDGIAMRPPIEHKFTGMNNVQTVPLNFYQQQAPPKIHFRPHSMVLNNTRPAFKLAMSVEPDSFEDEDGNEEKAGGLEMSPWDQSLGIQRKIHEGSNQSLLSSVTKLETTGTNKTLRSPRRKRQIFGLKAIETNNIPNMYPIFTSSEFNDNMLMSSPSFLDSLTFMPATIVTQRSKNRFPMRNQFVDHSDPFSNPFPTVPLPSFERTQGKSSKIKKLFIKPDVHQMLPSYSAPPLKYNPQTGTFYEPIFGSEIPIHLTFSDFQRMPDNLLNKPHEGRIKAPSISEEVAHSPPRKQHPHPLKSKGNKGEKMPAKVLSYEYMYRPVTNEQSSRKRQPVADNALPMAQVTYEKVNIPPLRLKDEVPVPKYRFPEKLPANPRRPAPVPSPPIKHDVQVFKRPLNEPRPKFVASLNHAIDRIVQQNNFDPPKPVQNSDYRPSENVIDERKPMQYQKPPLDYELVVKQDHSRNREPPQLPYVPEEEPIRQSMPKQFIPYETPDTTNHFSEQPNVGRDVNANEYLYTTDGNQGSQTKLHSTSYAVGKNYNDNHGHRYTDADIHELPATTVIPPSSTRFYRPHSFQTRPTPVAQETDNADNSGTPVYGQKLHRSNYKNNGNQFDTNHMNANRGDYSENKKEIVIEKQWYPEAPYTRVYTTPSTTTTTEKAQTTSSYSDWPVFKKHQNYLPPADTGIKPVILNDFEEETVVEDGSDSSPSDQNNQKETPGNEYAPKYPETFSVPQHYTTSPPSIAPSTNTYYEHYPTNETPLNEYSEYPSSIKNYHETKSDSGEVTVKMNPDEITTPVTTRKVEEEPREVLKINSPKKGDYSKFLNRFRGGVAKKPTSAPTTEAYWTTSSVTTSLPPKEKEVSKPVTSYGTRVGVTRAPKTKVSVHASISTSSIRKPVYTSNTGPKNQDAEESISHNSKTEQSPPRISKPVIGYNYQVKTTKKPERPSSSVSRESKIPSRAWTRFGSSTSTTTTTTQTVPLSTTTAGTTTTLGTTTSPLATTTPALFTGKVHNLATLFDTFDGEEALEGDYDVVEEQPSKREEDLSSTTPSSQSSTQSFLKVYSSSSAGALNTRLSGLRMKNLFGHKKRLDSPPSS